MTTDEIAAAFARPEARVALSAGPDPLDRIFLRDHVREAEIGAFQGERGLRQRLRFDVVAEVRPSAGPADDDVDRILSYDRLTEAIDAALGASRLDLLETLAERIAALILAEPRAARVVVRVEKLDRGPGALGVEIVRSRAAAPPAPPADAPKARVAFLANAVLADPGLPAMLDQLVADALPLVLCVGPPDAVPPQAGAALPQRRIDLLAVEQNAWMLAARDPRCAVVATRTELDWALRHGQASVWAPGKLVLDAAEGPRGTDGLALAAWLARLLGAAELRAVGAEPPANAGVPAARGTVARPLG